MAEDSLVYRIGPSVEDDRPAIDFDDPSNRGIDWGRLDAVLRGGRPDADYSEVSVVVRAADAASWGCYSVPGTLGLFSGEAVRCMGRPALRMFRLLPARLNGAEYYFLKVAEVLPCLDRARSEVTPFRSAPGRIKSVEKYAFHTAMIADPLVFSIPETYELFATPKVHRSLVRGRIPGFRFIPLV